MIKLISFSLYSENVSLKKVKCFTQTEAVKDFIQSLTSQGSVGVIWGDLKLW